MSDETRPDEAPDQITPPEQPTTPDASAAQDVAFDQETAAAESTAATQSAYAPPATGPGVEPPPVAGWPDTTPTQPFPAEQPSAVESEPAYHSQPPSGAQPHQSAVAPAVIAAVLAALVVGAFAGLAGGFIGAKLVTQPNGLTAQQTAGAVASISASGEPVVAAAAAAVPSVVNIDITGSASAGGQNGLPSTHPSVPLDGNGSGVAFKSVQGGGTYILTNNHVVESAKTITVRSPGGQSWPATVVGRDPDNDIAVVKISGSLPLINLGESKTLVVGQTVVAIGSPYGLEHTVTSGVVSALGRSLSDVGSTGQSQPLVDTIQTDAAINPGNSGGALVDIAGRLVGINTAIYSQSGSAAGIGFAIPVDTAVRVADELISTGKVAHPFIGLVGTDITPPIATQKKLPVSQGALVEQLVPGLGAAQGGIKVGDIVTAVDGVPITSMTDMVAQIRKHSPGEAAQLTVLRSGQTLKIKVTVSDRPASISSTVPPSSTTTTPAKP